MFKLLTDRTGFQFAVVKGDSHLAKWSEEQHRLCTDQLVIDKIMPRLKPGDTVIDAGACIGDHTIIYGLAVGPTGRVFAFEPNLPAFVCLAINMRDMAWVEVINQGLASEERTTAIKPNNNLGMAHVSDIFTGQAAALITLDSLRLTRCDFIKMDIEGYEPLALVGAMDTIRRYRPLIFIELNDSALARYGFAKDDVLNPLLAQGYRLEFLEPEHNLGLPQVDVFMVPK